MELWILKNESFLRIIFFIGIFIIVALWEIIAPRRPLNYSRPIRWYSNFGIVLINNIIVRLLFPVLASGLAAQCYEKGWVLRYFVVTPDMHRVHHSIIRSE